MGGVVSLQSIAASPAFHPPRGGFTGTTGFPPPHQHPARFAWQRFRLPNPGGKSPLYYARMSETGRPQINSQLRVQDGRGRSWTQSGRVGNNPYVVESGGDISGKLNEEMRRGASWFLGTVRIPRCLFVDFPQLGIGSSYLNTEGILDKPTEEPFIR